MYLIPRLLDNCLFTLFAIFYEIQLDKIPVGKSKKSKLCSKANQQHRRQLEVEENWQMKPHVAGSEVSPWKENKLNYQHQVTIIKYLINVLTGNNVTLSIKKLRSTYCENWQMESLDFVSLSSQWKEITALPALLPKSTNCPEPFHIGT